ncbi:hypothetical protein GA0116948_11515 [Chitinophaga costaii]|uniref:DUF4468 domain-containing protein n=2 Tax=Chitinophaga costaii TaxID=1335309 RepID=A0A1C4FLD3_9BACT|nr:hypothetical protein [Chitinophaga costaii]PUZ30002.1 hypothetical protein DCM91_00535 [Chitinophaga costaii]SCC56291.1 hypothetical protein GA0116948_11515 [Chitinophaga costaii]
MNRMKTGWVFVWLLFISLQVHAQSKYVQIIVAPSTYTYGPRFVASLVPLTGQKTVVLNFPGKSKQELTRNIFAYLQQRPQLILKPKYSNEDLITYRDFSIVCDSSKCMAYLAALTYVYAMPEDGKIQLRFGKGSTLFSSLYKVDLRITRQDDVASIGNAPFNEYKFVQPEDGGELRSNKILSGYHTAVIHYGIAYPESIYDPKGKLINPGVKQIIEQYYDTYITDLNDFLGKLAK